MKKVISSFVIYVFLLAGCATPAITSYTKEGVTLKYDPLLKTEAEIAQDADKMCGQFKRKAHLLSSTQKHSLDFVYAHFECK